MLGGKVHPSVPPVGQPATGHLQVGHKVRIEEVVDEGVEEAVGHGQPVKGERQQVVHRLAAGTASASASASAITRVSSDQVLVQPLRLQLRQEEPHLNGHPAEEEEAHEEHQDAQQPPSGATVPGAEHLVALHGGGAAAAAAAGAVDQDVADDQRVGDQEDGDRHHECDHKVEEEGGPGGGGRRSAVVVDGAVRLADQAEGDRLAGVPVVDAQQAARRPDAHGDAHPNAGGHGGRLQGPPGEEEAGQGDGGQRVDGGEDGGGLEGGHRTAQPRAKRPVVVDEVGEGEEAEERHADVRQAEVEEVDAHVAQVLPAAALTAAKVQHRHGEEIAHQAEQRRRPVDDGEEVAQGGALLEEGHRPEGGVGSVGHALGLPFTVQLLQTEHQLGRDQLQAVQAEEGRH